ncbi:GntR family transcriptional regulator, partial [Liquorilactobacillus vini]|uniref:GntR family transcriptional regulator n=1 Tax=Liquorilactobacillus vini TaxID=238015 RepID=UPI000556106B
QLVKIPGKGTFVTIPDVAYPLNNQLFSIAEILEAQHISYTTQVIHQELMFANREVAKALNIQEKERYLYLRRVRFVKGKPLILIENRINVNLCPGIEKINFNNVSLFTKLEEISKRRISFAKSTYEALAVGTERGNVLNLSPSSPILKMQQTVYMSKDEPVEYGSVWMKANKYFLTTTLQRR